MFTLHLLQVMDKHLSILAKQHIETRFVKINAEKSPFLAEKLKIIVLPTLALIKNAKVDDYVVCIPMELRDAGSDICILFYDIFILFSTSNMTVLCILY